MFTRIFLGALLTALTILPFTTGKLAAAPTQDIPKSEIARCNLNINIGGGFCGPCPYGGFYGYGPWGPYGMYAGPGFYGPPPCYYYGPCQGPYWYW